jgi:hypothetical protein
MFSGVLQENPSEIHRLFARSLDTGKRKHCFLSKETGQVEKEYKRVYWLPTVFHTLMLKSLHLSHY